MKLATHFHLVLKLRMSGSTPYTFMAYTRTTVPFLVLLLIAVIYHVIVIIIIIIIIIIHYM
jgi:hypothetical protein